MVVVAPCIVLTPSPAPLHHHHPQNNKTRNDSVCPPLDRELTHSLTHWLALHLVPCSAPAPVRGAFRGGWWSARMPTAAATATATKGWNQPSLRAATRGPAHCGTTAFGGRWGISKLITFSTCCRTCLPQKCTCQSKSFSRFVSAFAQVLTKVGGFPLQAYSQTHLHCNIYIWRKWLISGHAPANSHEESNGIMALEVRKWPYCC